LELLGLNNKFEVSAFSEEPLQVESAVLQEIGVFGANHFLLWHEWNGTTSPSFKESFVKIEEVTVATLTLPRALLVYAFN